MKILTNQQLKKIIGGKVIQECSASADCRGGGSISCSGFSVGSIGGCNATDAGYGGGGGNGQVSCVQFEVGIGFIINSFSSA